MAKSTRQVGNSSAIKTEPVVLVEETVETPEVAVAKTPEIVEAEPVVEKAPLNIEPVMEAEHKERTEAITDLTKEEKLVKFIENSTGKLVKINDFLKSLYPAAAYNEPPLWKQQIVSRQIRLMLSKMHNNGSIKIVNNIHSMLGDCYFDAEGKAKHYDLDSLSVSVEK